MTEDVQVIPAQGHTEETIPGYAATCTETGLAEGKKCSACGEIMVAQEEIPALGHTEETIPGYAATCTETGLTEGKKCTVCGEILVEQAALEMLEHEWICIPGKDPTCVEPGLSKGEYCAVCGEISIEQEEIEITDEHTYDSDNDAVCNICGHIRQMVDAYRFENYRVIFADKDTTHKNFRVEIYDLGDKTVADPTDEKALRTIDPKYTTRWGSADINNILITDAGNYVLLLKYNVDTGAAIKVPLVISVSADPKLIIDKNNKLVVEYSDASIANPRAYIYNVGDAVVEDIYDEAALQKITAPTQVWGLSSILKKQLAPGTYVIHLHYNVAAGAKSTVALKVTI